MDNTTPQQQLPIWQFFSPETLLKAMDETAPAAEPSAKNSTPVEVRAGRYQSWPAHAVSEDLQPQLEKMERVPFPLEHVAEPELDAELGAQQSFPDFDTLQTHHEGREGREGREFPDFSDSLQKNGVQEILPIIQPTPVAHGVTTLFSAIRRDVYLNRDRLLTLNASRRHLVERRLEFIARKVARVRGERMNRSLALPEILKESFRNPVREKTLGHLALERFASEVALHHLMQLFLLKRLDHTGLRAFAQEDLGRVNFAVYSFLNQNSLAFTQDRHSWNFVRPNVYSWYGLSSEAKKECAALFKDGLTVDLPSFGWSAQDFLPWLRASLSDCGLEHLDFTRDTNMANAVWDFIQDHLGISLVSRFHGQTMGKKVFMPTLEGGGFALKALDVLLSQLKVSGRRSAVLPNSEDNVLTHSLWSCESEGLETFFSEVLSLLCTIDSIAERRRGETSRDSSVRVPNCLHVVQGLGLELHNQDQLSLIDMQERALVQTAFQNLQGSAAQIQQYESFDISIVTDHPDRAKSAKWLKALSDQLPYWRQFLGAGTNLNWGELHLFLAISKLKDQGHCVYLSHKVFAENGDGEKFRRAILGMATLDYFLELPEEIFGDYRYMYVFTRESSKQRRDLQRVRFGRWPFARNARLSVSELFKQRLLEESSSTQIEISERGWDQIFVRGAAPLVRHLNHKFPKLFQLASVQLFTDGRVAPRNENDLDSLFRQQSAVSAIAFTREGQLLRFEALAGKPSHERILICPHNPQDIPWLTSLLNSAAVQFWVKMQVTQDNGPVKLQDLRSLPVVDLTQVDSNELRDAFDWLGRTRPGADALREWIKGLDLTQASARFAALSKRRSQIQATVSRYRHLFDVLSPDASELNPESVTQFYPSHLLSTVLQSPEIRIQYLKKELTSTNPANWIVVDVVQGIPTQGRVVLHILTKQGPQVAISVPQSIAFYMNAQLRKLKDFTWSEVLSLLRVPRDTGLFTAQTTEITRVVTQTLRDIQLYDRFLEELSLDLFEIASEDRQYLR